MKRGVCLLLLCAFLLLAAPGTATAEERGTSGAGEEAALEQEGTGKSVIPEEEAALSPLEDPLLGYLEQCAGVLPEATLQERAGDSLSGLDALLYQKLKAVVEEIAAGTRQMTIVSIPEEEYAEYPLIRRNLPPLTGEAAARKVVTSLLNSIAWSRIHYALLADCPYDLYWHDKTTSGLSWSCGFRWWSPPDADSDTAYVALTGLTVRFAVSADYSDGEYRVRGDLGSLLETVQNDAKAIVAGSAGKSDYQKLLSYQNAITLRASYDYNAMSGNNRKKPYGDPWQLIYVFDGNPDTKVVCEGYAKAFKYLCDLSTFSDPDLSCYLVTGALSATRGVTEAESQNHMWNHVTLGGKTWLVDPTLCDDGQVAYPQALFLAAPPDGWNTRESGYAFTVGTSSIRYDDIDLQSTGNLTYEPDAAFLTLCTQACTPPEGDGPLLTAYGDRMIFNHSGAADSTLVAVSYGANGQMLDLALSRFRSGYGETEVRTAGAKTVSVFLMDDAMRPLTGKISVDGTE